MKKAIVPGIALLLALAAGCSTVESTQKFNAMGLGTPNEKAVCHTYVEIPGIFFFGLPIIVGSPKGDNEWTVFQWTLNNENAVYMLTKEAKSKGAARVINVTVSRTHDSLSFLPFLSYQTIQASGVGVRTKGAAIDRAAQQYDAAP
ncbi:MAG: hypothetical protein J6Y54_00875 [Lentisphaeria bacterium]|jgi:hypothetical protein|nr:hypothetical protein [Lentisphaeria bacterium]